MLCTLMEYSLSITGSERTFFIVHTCFHPNNQVPLDSMDRWEMFRLRHKLWLIVILFFSFPWIWNCFFGFSLVNSIANKLNHKLRLLKRRYWSLGHVYSSIDCSLGLAIAYIYSDQLRANFVIKRHNESNPKCYFSSCIVRTIVIFVRTASSHHLEKYYT